MSPILYIEARCDLCNDEISSHAEEATLALHRNGKLVCPACAIPDQVFAWFTVPKLADPTEEDEQAQETRDKALVFVEHIEKHLLEMFPDEDAKVLCKICDKQIDEIYEERARAT